MPSFDIPEADLNPILTKAILDSISEETRDTLLKGALAFLVAPNNSSYGGYKSPLQEAFNVVVRKLAYQVAEQVFEERGFSEKVALEAGKLVDAMPEVWEDVEVKGAIFDVIFNKAREFYNASDKNRY